ncbi:hypothetical protein V1477_013054 [Vespula maculifrons]|uniref:Uncharacterized protein n=1 Tax=Vespula maculifrons TaxID=7453 RepID=A0ABD2BV13_VESMC
MAVLARTKASTWDSVHSPINLARAGQIVSYLMSCLAIIVADLSRLLYFTLSIHFPPFLPTPPTTLLRSCEIQQGFEAKSHRIRAEENSKSRTTFSRVILSPSRDDRACSDRTMRNEKRKERKKVESLFENGLLYKT